MLVILKVQEQNMNREGRQGEILSSEKKLTKATSLIIPLSMLNHLTTLMAVNTKEVLVKLIATCDCNVFSRKFWNTKSL